MENFNHNQVIRGTFGRLYMDSERLSNVKSFEAKITYNYEDVYVNGDMVAKKILMGASIAGTMTLYKVDSLLLRKYAGVIGKGQVPDVKMTSILDDPANGGREEITLGDVKFDEILLSKFENNTVTEEEVPFTAGYYTPDSLLNEG